MPQLRSPFNAADHAGCGLALISVYYAVSAISFCVFKTRISEVITAYTEEAVVQPAKEGMLTVFKHALAQSRKWWGYLLRTLPHLLRRLGSLLSALYPQLVFTAFSMLPCQSSPSVSATINQHGDVVSSTPSVECHGSEHKAVWDMAWATLVVIAVGYVGFLWFIGHCTMHAVKHNAKARQCWSSVQSRWIRNQPFQTNPLLSYISRSPYSPAPSASGPHIAANWQENPMFAMTSGQKPAQSAQYRFNIELQ